MADLSEVAQAVDPGVDEQSGGDVDWTMVLQVALDAARATLRGAPDSEDLAADTAERVVRALSEGRRYRRVGGVAWVSAVRLCRNHLSRRGFREWRQVPLSPSGDLDLPEGTGMGPASPARSAGDAAVERVHAVDTLRALMASADLQPVERLVFVLVDLAYTPLHEVAVRVALDEVDVCAVLFGAEVKLLMAAGLTESRAEVVVLRNLYDMPHSDIAVQLDKNPTGIRKLFSEGLRSLSAWKTRHEGGGS